MGTTIIAYEDIERFFDHVEHLEAVVNAARILHERLRQLPDGALLMLYGYGLPEFAFIQLSLTLDALDEEER